MATVTPNPILSNISGKIGDVVVYHRGEKHFVRKWSPRTKPPSAAQLALYARFREAAAYGRLVQNDPTLRNIYEAAAWKRKISVYQLAVTDFLRPPKIKDVNLEDFTGAPGGKIWIRARDDFEVSAVRVRIAQGDTGVLLEEGTAQFEPTTKLWTFQQTMSTALGQALAIEITALDRPGHSDIKKLFWAPSH